MYIPNSRGRHQGDDNEAHDTLRVDGVVDVCAGLRLSGWVRNRKVSKPSNKLRKAWSFPSGSKLGFTLLRYFLRKSHTFLFVIKLNLCVLLTKVSKPCTYDLLEFELGIVYKFSYSKVLWAHLVDAELLHAGRYRL